MGIEVDGANQKLILDSDGDTYLEAATDDTIKVYIAGAHDATISANAINVLSGTTLTIDSGATIANSGTATGFGAVTALNNATANELVTVGSTTTELDAESGLTYTDGALVIGGTTPSLTIGDAGAEDTKIVFDGNAQDFHIGLDDSADDLVIGLGSSLGTTTHIAIDETGAVRMPLQPAFHALSNAENNQTGNGTTHTMLWAKSDIIDNNADFASGTFTAPVTGTYMFGVNMMMNSMSGLSYSTLKLVTSNRNYERAGGVDIDGSNLVLAQLADMDASDTATVTIQVGGIGADTADIGVDSSFYGWLVA